MTFVILLKLIKCLRSSILNRTYCTLDKIVVSFYSIIVFRNCLFFCQIGIILGVTTELLFDELKGYYSPFFDQYFYDLQ